MDLMLLRVVKTQFLVYVSVILRSMKKILLVIRVSL